MSSSTRRSYAIEPEKYAQITQLAKQRNMSVSKFIRYILEQQIKTDLNRF